MLYLAMSAASNTLQAQSTNSHNIANVNTTGFRADLAQFRSMPVYGDGLASRVFALQERPGVDYSNGTINYTGNELDIAINGDGWFAVMMPDGSEAYTRAGDLHISDTGILENGGGYPIIGNGGQILVPQNEKMELAADGTISIRPTGQDEKTLATIDRIKLVRPSTDQLDKGGDGLFRKKDGTPAEADASVTIVSGALETSNVNLAAALVDMIGLARQFEMNIKAMTAVEENDQAAQQLLRFS